ncbi:MAG: hypothetical protein ACOX9E_16360 [Lentisphaeria bacterium]
MIGRIRRIGRIKLFDQADQADWAAQTTGGVNCRAAARQAAQNLR